ncbi:hypothetical protein GCM10028807_60510 [Spirosoma daeguense]
MIFSLLLLAYWLLPNFTQNAEPQQTFAVIIGISDYKLGEPGKGDLTYSGNDAEGICELLESSICGSVPAENIRFLNDRNASLANIRQALTIFKRATPNDRIIFFFSGHGDKGKFLPYDAYTTGPGFVLQHKEIKDAFRNSVAGTKILLADACMSGSITDQRVYTHSLHDNESAVIALDTTTLQHHEQNNTNVVILMSSYSDAKSQEISKLRQSAFTYFLIRGAQGSADKNRDGIVTIKELHYYVSLNVQRITRQPDGRIDQIPKVTGRFDENLAFTRLNP